MPTGATMAPGAVNGNSSQSETADKNAAVSAVPFTRASFRHFESNGTVSKVLTASQQDAGVQEVNSYGYMRAILLRVRATGGAGTSVAGKANAPWNVLQDIILSEPNGATILHLSDGYQLYLANKYGGYKGYNDPRQLLSAIGATTGNFEFVIRIPVEISERDALGALPNQNAASSFQVRYKIADSASIYSTAPTTLPTITVDMYLEAWAQPLGSSPAGGVNQTTPPALNTTQYWSVQQYNVVSGLNRIRLTRVGNYLRNLVFMWTESSARTESDWPDDFKLWLDSTPVELNIAAQLWRDRIFDRYGYIGTLDAAGARDTGVFPYDFCHEFDGVVGHELRDAWLLTNTSSRLEIEGTFGNAGTLYVITNDITVAGNVFL